MMHKKFSGLALMVLGTLALLQVLGIYYFGLTFWPTVVLWIGLEIVFSSLFEDFHGPSIFGAAIGLVTAGWGLVQILSNLGVMAAISIGQMISIGWPILLVALGLSLLFRRTWRCR
ncbi:MAG TPA: hypothetical protein VNT75_09880 [Symbiobacteriaceae bacterium]|nr:hypothetical protein [Symbiobacteriaceae bacterium]